MITRILAEYRYGNKVVLLERAEHGPKKYKVSVFQSYKTAEEAQKTFLKDIPKPSQDYYTRLIAENDIK